MSESEEGETLVEAAVRVLNRANPFEKARLGDSVANAWLDRSIARPYDPRVDLHMPDRPARLAEVKVVSLGKTGSFQSRQAIVHSLAHTECWAIDLSWQESMLREFFTDFVKVAQDEGRHFMLPAARMQELGSFYGALPAHDGLWDSAASTSKSLLARLAVENYILKARGLDVLPTTISRFCNGGDDETVDLLEAIVYPEEITHCVAGVRWFRYLSLRSLEQGEHKDGESGTKEDEEVITKFHEIVRAYFRGPLKPSFNRKAREAARFGPRGYEPLAVKGD